MGFAKIAPPSGGKFANPLNNTPNWPGGGAMSDFTPTPEV